MNIDQIKTFLELNRSRHFKKTSEAMYVTQSTVSTRINTLEQELGCELFKRTSRSVDITPAGRRFVVHAQSILAIWRRAQQEAASVNQHAPKIAVGGLFVLWDLVLQDWLEKLHTQYPAMNLLAESHDHAFLVRQLVDGVLDLIFIFEPPQYQALTALKIADFPLWLVSSQPDQAVATAMSEDYIMVDWGEGFTHEHAHLFAHYAPAIRRVNQARLALKLMLSEGGSAYLSSRSVKPMCESGKLFRVKGAPTIKRTIYAVHLRESRNLEFINQALEYF